jgi:hypothetical protein
MFVVSICKKSPRGFFRPGSYSIKQGLATNNIANQQSELRSYAYLWHIDDISFHNLEQGMLDTLSRYITTDAHIASGLADLVSFINVNNTTLASLNVLTTFEVQLEMIVKIDIRKKRRRQTLAFS